MDKDVVHVLLNVSWQWSLLVGLTWLMSRVRRNNPNLGHALWLAALIALPLLFVLNCFVPGVHLNHAAVSPPAATQETIARAEPVVPPTATGTFSLSPSLPLTPSTDAESTHTAHSATLASDSDRTWHTWVALAWIVGMAVGLVRLCGGAWQLGRLRRASRMADATLCERLGELGQQLGFHRPVQLRISAKLDAPISFGWVRPCVMLPEGLSEEQHRLVLLHELAHLCRRDWLTNLFVQCIGIVFFFHPLFYFGRLRLNEFRERVCDDWVLTFSPVRADYAQCLTDLLNQGRQRLGITLALVHSRPKLLPRVQAILDEARPLNPQLQRRTVWLLAGILVALLPLLSIAQFMPLRTFTLALPAQPAGNETPATLNEQEPPGMIEGQVLLAEEQTPLADALVWVEIWTEDGSTFGPVRTDAKGHYQLAGLPFGRELVLHAQAHGTQAWRESEISLNSAQPSATRHIELQPAFGFEGHVLGATDVEHLRIRAQTMDYREVNNPGIGARCTGDVAVNADGSFRFWLTRSEREPADADLYPDQQCHGFFEAGPVRDIAEFRIRFQVAGSEPVMLENIRLTRGKIVPSIQPTFTQAAASIAGRVIDHEGNPVPDVRLALADVTVQGTRRSSTSTQPPVKAISDATGSYRLDSVPSGLHAIQVHVPDELRDLYQAPNALQSPFMVPKGAAMTNVDIVLQPPTDVWVRGRILFPDGQPLADASLHLENSRKDFDGRGSGKSSGGLRTDAEGRYEFHTFHSGIFTFEVEYDDWWAQSEPFPVKPGERIEGKDLILRQESREVYASGRLLEGETGQPLVDQSVNLEGAMTPTGWAQYRIQTDEDGRFQLDKPLADGEYRIRSFGRFGRTEPEVLQAVDGRIPPTDVRLWKPIEIRVHVLSEHDRQPVANGEYGLWRIQESGGGSRGGGDPFQNGSFSLRVDDPRFVAYQVTIAAPGHRTVGREIPLDDIHADGLNVEVILPYEGYVEIRGQVFLPDGSTASDLGVNVVYESPLSTGIVEQLSEPQSVTDDRGMFSVPYLGSGRHRLLLSGPGDSLPWMDWLELNAEQEPIKQVSIQLRQPGTLQGQIVFPQGGVPPAPLQVVMARTDLVDVARRAMMNRVPGRNFLKPHEYVATVDEELGFQIDEVRPGTYQILTWKPDKRMEDLLMPLQQVTVQSNQVSRVTLQVPPRASFSGRVTDAATGEPVADVGVMAFVEDLPIHTITRTESDGTFKLDGVMAGTQLRFEVRRTDDYAPQGAHLTIASDGVLQITPISPGISQDGNGLLVALSPGVSVSGVMLTERPLPSLVIHCKEIEGWSLLAADGTFTIERLPTGRYTFQVLRQGRGGGSVLAEQIIDVPEQGEVTGIEFRLE